MEEDQMTVNNFYSQKLKLKAEEPVYIKNYRLQLSHKKEIDNQVNNLLKNNLIEPSMASYNSSVIIVPKKDTDGKKKYRMCIDYRQVNQKLVADKFPLPRVDEILDSLGRATFFTVIHPDSRDITSFSTPKGSFRW